MPDNLYAPPGAGFPAPKRQRRTVPVYLIAAWCAIQFAAVAYFVSHNWQSMVTLVQMGAEPMARFVGRLLFPTLLLVAGLQLFYMRKSASYFFGLYFAWSLQKVLYHPNSGLGLIDLMITTGIFIYCIRLQRAGQLN
ncbi:hypothetical protein [Pseudoduganella sp.]|uniref:hypothetical protein n=1 Tax=Pseudoduganella sp. TaxID=1880898 RepID=UPI0035B16B40